MAGRQQVVLPTVDEALPIIVQTVTSAVKKNPLKVSTYIMGLLVGVFFSGIASTTQQLEAYEAALPDGSAIMKLNKKQMAADMAYQQYYSSKGWFSCDHLCTVNYDKYMGLKKDLDGHAAQVNTQMRQARGILGVFSTAAVGEARDMFWGAFARAKSMAKRQTMWDAFFVGMRSMGRDEGMASYVANMLIRFLSNLFFSLVFSLFTFMWSVWEVVTAYNANIFAGLVFWVLASTAAAAFLATVMGGMTLAIGGAVAGVAYVASSNAGQARRVGAGQQYGRMHYE